jgi:hypothetical protein
VTTAQLSNPFSTGGGGSNFETRVQASFAALMLAGGYAPCLPPWPISRLQLQAKFLGYETDDLAVWVKEPRSGRERRLIVQIKHAIGINRVKTSKFPDVIRAAWVDFNNAAMFTPGEDQIALVTGPISATDDEVRQLLDWARMTPSADEFIMKVELADFSSHVKRQKLRAFRGALDAANGQALSDKTLHHFLQHFHLLGYDLDIRSGVTLSLLQSLIGQYSPENVQMLWARLVDEIQSCNMNGGAVTRESMAEDLRDIFAPRPPEVIPDELAAAVRPIEIADWSQSEHIADLAIAALLGAWDEAKEADLRVVSALAGEDYGAWIPELREVLLAPGSPLSLRDGTWRVVDRGRLWRESVAMLFDDVLGKFGESACDVLLERDPQFDLPIDDRYAAALHGKVLSHSHALRGGVADGLALLGSCSAEVEHASRGRAEATARLAVRKILGEADWILWAGLNDVLPSLAEASPSEFLGAVEAALQTNPCRFDDVFAQEACGVTGRNYMTGLLWALEGLAWDPALLVRVVVALGHLAARDPGGNWGNRPENSIRTILLPWLPQTLAPVDKRIVAVRTLVREKPDVAWTLLLSLLPNQHQISTGSHRPTWRRIIPDDWEKGVTGDEYWGQVSAYADLAVSMASDDLARMGDLVDHLSGLPAQAFDRFLGLLASETVTTAPEEDRVSLWNSLVAFTVRHTKSTHTDWAAPAEIVSRVETVAERLAPEDPMHRYRRLFGGSDFELFESYGDYGKEREKLDKAREQAIAEIVERGDVEAVIQFARTVQAKWQVGRVLGIIGDSGVDHWLLPAHLDTSDEAMNELVRAYVRRRHHEQGWDWVDHLDRSGWTVGQLTQVLASLPFTREAWDRASSWLGGAEGEYWMATAANPSEANGERDYAVDQLIRYDRPRAAVRVLHWALHETKSVDIGRAVKALLAGVSSKEPENQLDHYEIVEIIKALQEDGETNPNDLFMIEWAYLPVLDGTHGATPRLLDERLSSDPAFFLEVIRLLYTSKKGSGRRKKKPSEQEQALAHNAWRLLHQWKRVPGTDNEGGLSTSAFREWLKAVCQEADESGHREVALSHVGQVLFYAPAYEGGLWIHNAVAEALNASNTNKMRTGYCMEAVNSRGVHWVDPTGAPERELAVQYRQKADDVENAGYQRFAASLRQLAESFDADADRIVAEHEGEEMEQG